MIKDAERLEEIRKISKLLEECFFINKIDERTAIESLIYTLIIYFGANKISKKDVKAHLNIIENYFNV
jgi:hypothetical protein